MRAKKKVALLKIRPQREILGCQRVARADRGFPQITDFYLRGKQIKIVKLKEVNMAGKIRNKKAESENFKAKKVVVEEIKGKIQSSKSVVLASYDRLTVAEVTALRGKFTQAQCEYKVYKNTLVRKAFEELGVTAFNNDLNGATVFVFCPDEHLI